ncbi:MAG TPA: DUF2079 domain-containing protein [Polyangiaceae bacterium]|nr:DUF2079 domain-containing protein [Polyangiaceae bacterium]
MKSSLSPSAFRLGSRAVGLLGVTAFFFALGTGLVRSSTFSTAYFWRNEVAQSERLALLAYALALPVIAALAGAAAFIYSYPRGVAAAEKLYRVAVRLSPLGPLAMVPWLLRWDIWVGHDLAFLCAAMLVTLALGRALTKAIETLPLHEASPLYLLARRRHSVHAGTGNFISREPFLSAAVLAALLYITWFSYYTVVFHLSCRSGWDTSIEDNILWNISHGGPFFKASPALGPTGAHFRRHATLISYLLAPFYLLKPGAATVLVIQSTLQGLAAVPLFLFARRHVGQGFALLVSIAYLFHPALQESNLFEVHYLKFGPVFLFTALWLLDSGRNRLALLAAVLTMLVREDVASWVILLGLWGLMTGRDPRYSGGIAALGCVYVGLIKFVAMPAAGHGQDELTFIYSELVPKGSQGFGAVLGTVFGNPAFTLESLFDPAKLLYFLQLFLPLAFIPLRRTIGWLALIPGGIYCFISTHYSPFVDIHFQYSAHILTFAFPALVLVLADSTPVVERPDTDSLPALSRAAALRHSLARRYGFAASMLVATLIGTYQYGAILQQNTSRGGPIPYTFGWNDEGRARRHSIDELLKVIPPDAKVTASAFTVPQISARSDAYSLSISIYDADFILAPSGPKEHLPDEKNRIREVLKSGEFGVLKVVPPFFVAKRGAPTKDNESLLRDINAL